jgi:AAA+ ATPase superfamily predicted ATPase
LDFFDDLDSIIRFNFVDQYKVFNELISPSYLIEEPYRYLLVSIARGDGRLSNVFRKARIGETLGTKLLNELVELGIVEFEDSREPALKAYPSQKLEKSLRSYKIEPKIRFKKPFHRFWFGFVEPYHKQLNKGESKQFYENFNQHFSRLHSFVFEQLSQELLNTHYDGQLLINGNYWDKHSEFDIWATHKEGFTILGECKYTNRRVCKSELSKLQQKAETSKLNVNQFALFSKSGFSNELKNGMTENLLLFEMEDFRKLLG